MTARPADDEHAADEHTDVAASLSYAQALAELDAILDQLERGDADIDALAARVGRAAELVRSCRARLDEARIEVTRIVADLDQGDGLASGPTDEPAPSQDRPAGARDTSS